MFNNKTKMSIKKSIVLCLGILLTIVATLPYVYGNAQDNTKQIEEMSIAKEKDLQEIESMKSELQNLKRNPSFTKTELNRYNELVDKIGTKEMECNVYDYKKDLEDRINTIETAIKDMQREMKDGTMPDNIVPDAENRIQKLSPIVVKYQGLLKDAQSQSDFDYNGLSTQFDEEIQKVYEEIN